MLSRKHRAAPMLSSTDFICFNGHHACTFAGSWILSINSLPDGLRGKLLICRYSRLSNCTYRHEIMSAEEKKTFEEKLSLFKDSKSRKEHQMIYKHNIQHSSHGMHQDVRSNTRLASLPLSNDHYDLVGKSTPSVNNPSGYSTTQRKVIQAFQTLEDHHTPLSLDLPTYTPPQAIGSWNTPGENFPHQRSGSRVHFNMFSTSSDMHTPKRPRPTLEIPLMATPIDIQTPQRERAQLAIVHDDAQLLKENDIKVLKQISESVASRCYYYTMPNNPNRYENVFYR